MSQRNAKHPSRKSRSERKSQPRWQERASNKRQKKRIVQGEATRGAKHSEKKTGQVRFLLTCVPLKSKLYGELEFSATTGADRKERRQLGKLLKARPHGLLAVISTIS